jgi:SAM-dependent methyltransferase
LTRSGSDRDYWEDRARRQGAGAAGYTDQAMDAYEDRLRGAAIDRLVGRGAGRRLLDAGCGTGRWSVRLAAAGWVVTGVDISGELIGLAARAANVTYVERPLQDVDFPAASFDAWLSVTALQHITIQAEFDAAIDNLTRMLRPGGQAALLEYAPLRVIGPTPSYLRARDRGQWLHAITSRGYTRRSETGIRFLGHIPYMLAVRLLRRFMRPPPTLRWLRALCWALDLALARVPGITLLADVRLIVFEKAR